MIATVFPTNYYGIRLGRRAEENPAKNPAILAGCEDDHNKNRGKLSR